MFHQFKLRNLVALSILMPLLVFSSEAAPLRDAEQVLLKAPQAIAETVHTHISRMQEMNFFANIDDSDLYHGHFIFTNDLSSFNGDQPPPAILYHTAEHTGRWAEEIQQGMSIYKRTPRSIIGWPNTHIEPAHNLIDLSKLSIGRVRSFKNLGTLYADDLVIQNSELQGMDWSKRSEDRMKEVQVEFSDVEKVMYLSEMFLILPNPEGRFQLGELRYEVYLDLRNIKERVRYGTGYGPVIIEGKSVYPYQN